MNKQKSQDLKGWKVGVCALLGCFISFSAFAGGGEAESAITWKPYGFLKTSVVTTSQLVSSLGRMNLTAPTYALPTMNYGDDLPMSTFQAGQSRLGFYLMAPEHPAVKGQFEFDFMGAYHASATTTLFPRARVIQLIYHLRPGQTLEMGFGPDLFGYTKPFTYNFVSPFYMAGAMSSSRPQIKFLSQLRPTTQVGFALGLAKLNSNSSFVNQDGTVVGGIATSAERNLIPSIALRIEEKINPETTLGLGIIGGRNRYEKVVTGSNLAAATGLVRQGTFYGVNPFVTYHPGEHLKVNASAYLAQDLGYAGDSYVLSSPMKDAFKSLREAGGFISVRKMMEHDWGVLAGVGMAKILNGGGGSLYDLGVKEYYGLARNLRSNLGAFYHLSGKLDLFAEYTFLASRFYQKSDSTYSDKTAHVLDVGLHYPL